MDLIYPSVCGRLSLSAEPLPRSGRGEQQGVDILYEHTHGELIKTGDVKNVYVGRQPPGTFTLLLGTARHATGAVGQASTEEARAGLVQQLAAVPPEQVEGEYIRVQVSEEAAGGLAVRFVTDKYGFRPLYYIEAGGILYVSSHLWGLKFLRGGALPDVSLEALRHFYHFGITSNEDTLLRGVKKVPPASVFTVTPGSTGLSRYFDPLDLYAPDQYAALDDEAISRQIDERMTRAVTRRAETAGRIGLALSGGVDSGFIAKKLNEAGATVKAYNLAYGVFYDEHDRIDRLETRFGMDVTRLHVGVGDVIESVERANSLGSEPVGFNDAALRILARHAQQDGMDTLWDGDGADRLFLGMNSHLKYFRIIKLYEALKKIRLLAPFMQVVGHVRHPEARKLSLVLRNWRNGIPAYPERKYSISGGYDYAYEYKIFDLGIASTWAKYQQRVGATDFGLFFTYLSINTCPERFFHAPLEQQNYLGMQPVSPYWDDEIVSLALSIPTTMKLRDAKTKYVLRKAAALDGDLSYWMLPKIGLQSAFAFIGSTDEGRQWKAEQQAQIVRSDEYRYLSSVLREAKPDVDRLIPYIVWKKAHLGQT